MSANYYNIYSFLQEQAKNKKSVSSSARQIADYTGFDLRSVKRYLKIMVEKGNISVNHNFDQYGGNKTNTYSLIKPPDYTEDKNAMIEANRIRLFYCSMVSKRSDDEISGRAFTGYMKNFISVYRFCKEFELNYKTYVIACFYVFNEKWCESKFARRYPPPYIIASKKSALERYNNFFREFHKLSFLNVEEKDANELIAQDYYTWVKIGKPIDSEFLELFIQNVSLSPLFVASLPNIEPEFKRKIEILYGINPSDIENNTIIIKQLIGIK